MSLRPFVLVLLFSPSFSFSQILTQTIRGKVIDAEAQYPLPGATVILTSDTTTLKGATTDPEGNFRIESIPVGRHSLRVSFTGYENVVISNVVLSSAKELVLSIPMRESATALEDVVVVKATRDGDASNEMALVAATSFTVEETQRYAGSRGDPARMASNFAGVMGADDSRNDIVIRGNSPQGVLWRMEGINIPNPNHFNIPGTAGGPVSMINNKTLANSDFYTGAFPAEFGNSIAGVFDLKLRNGNSDKHEFSGQFGFLGTEAFAEGPLSKKGASYLATYRYSTLAIFSKLGIDIGTTAVPRYQDAAFKLNFPRKNNGSFSLFGLMGNSHTDILISEQDPGERNIYGSNDRDQYFSSGAITLGGSYRQPLSKSSFVTAALAFSKERTWAHHEFIHWDTTGGKENVVDFLDPILEYTFKTSKISGNVFYAKKANSKNTINIGVNSDLYLVDYLDSAKNIILGDPEYGTWRIRWNAKDQALLIQPFVQWKHSFGENTEFVAGLHSQYFTLGGAFVPAEPRIGLRFKPSDRNSFSFGAGLHSQIQAPYLYYYGDKSDANGNPILENKNMGFTRSLQIVGGYQRMLTPVMRMKIEAYYQYLFQIPVDKTISSSFSLVNTGAGFSRFFPLPLENKGKGRNYGAELTLEHFFSNGYLFLLTGSLFEAKYQGSDEVWRDTDFNGNYVVNALFTKEWKLAGRNSFALGGKVTTAGGRRTGPVDYEASEKQLEVVYASDTRNSEQFRPYFRADLKINYIVNRAKVTHEIGLDLVNIFGTQNILQLTWAPDPNDKSVSPIREEYQLGFLPLFYYRIDF